MKEEIEKFYADNNTPISKMVAVGVGRMYLTPASVRQAAEQVYADIQNGLEIKPIRIAWEVYGRAKSLKIVAEKTEHDRITKLEDELKWYRLPWRKRIFRRYEA